MNIHTLWIYHWILTHTVKKCLSQKKYTIKVLSNKNELRINRYRKWWSDSLIVENVHGYVQYWIKSVFTCESVHCTGSVKSIKNKAPD